MRENKIKILSDVDHVLQKPGMYVGDVACSNHKKWYLTSEDRINKQDINYCPALMKLFDEIISNSIDEGLRTDFQYANKIEVDINGNTVSVQDNGRGIPVEMNEEVGKTQAEIAFTYLRAGSNFTNESFVSIGTHGLGATLVNIMSSQFKAETDDGKKRLRVICANNMSTISSKVSSSTGSRGTYVEFTPDFSRFNGISKLDETHTRLIQKRVIDLACCYPQIQFKFNGKTVKSKSFKNYLSMIADEDTFVGIESEDWKVAVMTSDEPDHISFVNGIDTYEGGTHVDYVRAKIVNRLVDEINRKYKKLDIKPQDVRNHLTFVVITNSIKNPKFRSQTKEYIANAASEFDGLFLDVAEESFIKKIIKNENIILPIIETKKLKLEAEERIALKKANKANSKNVKIVAHIAANGSNWNHKTLFVTEGASAIGQLINVRDTARHGGFPLRGKPMNVHGEKPTEIVKNKELSSLMSIIGLQLGEDYDELNYGTIAIMSDADYDGISIRGLLINFFSLWPKLFKEGRIKVVKAPIVTVTDKKTKEVTRFYDLGDYDATKYSDNSRYVITYLKGLGSMTEQEYEIMVRQPILETITLDNVKMLDLAFGNDSDLRKEWLSTK